MDAAREKSSRGYQQLAVDADQLRQQLEKVYNEKPIDTYIRKCEELSKKLVEGKITASQYKDQTDRLAQSMHKGGEAQEESFGLKAVGRLTEFAAGLITVEKGAEFVARGFEEIAKRAEEAGQRSSQALQSSGSIVQAARSPEEFAAMAAETTRIRGTGVNTAQAQSIAAAMARSGVSGPDAEFIEKALHDRRITPEQAPDLIANIHGVQLAYKQAGTFQGIQRQALEAARFSNRFSQDEILALALRAKESGSDLPFDEVLATVAEIGRTTPQARRAGTEAEKFFQQGNTFEGREAAEAAAERIRIKGVAGGPDIDYIAGSPLLRSARDTEEAKANREITEEYLKSEPERLGTAIREGRRARAARRGRLDEFGEWAEESTFGRMRSWRSEIESEATGAYGAEKPFSDVNEETQRDIKMYLQAIKEQAERQTQIMEGSRRTIPLSGLGPQE